MDKLATDFPSLLQCQAEHGAGLSKALAVNLQVRSMAESGLTLQTARLQTRIWPLTLVRNSTEGYASHINSSTAMPGLLVQWIQGTKHVGRPLT